MGDPDMVRSFTVRALAASTVLALAALGPVAASLSAEAPLAAAAKIDADVLARPADVADWAIVMLAAPPTPARLAELDAAVGPLRVWTIVPAVGVVATPTELLALARAPDVVSVTARVAELALRESAGQIGAPTVWATGNVGTGVVVASIDTGVDDLHPDLDDGKVVARVSFEQCNPQALGNGPVVGACSDAAGPAGALRDAFGHGTHTAGTIAGAGEITGAFEPQDRYAGVAPGAKLVSVQVSSSGGVSLRTAAGYISTWAALNAVEWVVANRDALDIRVAANSWGSGMAFNGYANCLADPVARAVAAAIVAEPTLVWVFASGNEGTSGPGSVRSPGCLPEVITVGAVNRDNTIASFSSYGPTRGDGHPKPDVVAPGVGIVAAQTVTPSAYHAFNALDVALGTGPRDPSQQPFYTSSSGTSMATPHVAGLVALMVEVAPCLTQAQALAVLQATALDLGPAGRDDKYGHGLVQAPAAVAAADPLC